MSNNCILGLVMMILGACLRFGARSFAWPKTYSLSGPREATKWAIQEAAIGELSLVVFLLGGLLFVGKTRDSHLFMSRDSTQNRLISLIYTRFRGDDQKNCFFSPEFILDVSLLAFLSGIFF